MPVQDASTTRSETSERIRDAEQAREALVDQEITELHQLLDRVDGLTYEARRRLRRLEQHRGGIAPEWSSRRG